MFGGLYYNCISSNCSYLNLITASWNVGTGASSASYSASIAAQPNTYYTLWAFPSIVEYWDVYVDSQIVYEDIYGFSLLVDGIATPWVLQTAPGQYVETFSNVIELVSVYNVVLSPSLPPVVPTIYSISPAQGLVGASITVTISGANFDYSDTVVSDSGVSAVIQSLSPSEIVAIFHDRSV